MPPAFHGESECARKVLVGSQKNTETIPEETRKGCRTLTPETLHAAVVGFDGVSQVG